MYILLQVTAKSWQAGHKLLWKSNVLWHDVSLGSGPASHPAASVGRLLATFAKLVCEIRKSWKHEAWGLWPVQLIEVSVCACMSYRSRLRRSGKSLVRHWCAEGASFIMTVIIVLGYYSGASWLCDILLVSMLVALALKGVSHMQQTHGIILWK